MAQLSIRMKLLGACSKAVEDKVDQSRPSRTFARRLNIRHQFPPSACWRSESGRLTGRQVARSAEEVLRDASRS
jgi:hypothetical protein